MLPTIADMIELPAMECNVSAVVIHKPGSTSTPCSWPFPILHPVRRHVMYTACLHSLYEHSFAIFFWQCTRPILAAQSATCRGPCALVAILGI